jgi:hypothetical protein
MIFMTRRTSPQCRSDHLKLYTDYYVKQAGNGLPAFVGTRYQRGHGLGSILRKITSIALPILKKGASLVGKQAIRTGMNIATDAMQGQNIKQTIKRRMSQGLKDLVTQKGRGPPGERLKKRIKRSQRGYKRKVSPAERVIRHSAKRRKRSKDALD